MGHLHLNDGYSSRQGDYGVTISVLIYHFGEMEKTTTMIQYTVKQSLISVFFKLAIPQTNHISLIQIELKTCVVTMPQWLINLRGLLSMSSACPGRAILNKYWLVGWTDKYFMVTSIENGLPYAPAGVHFSTVWPLSSDIHSPQVASPVVLRVWSHDDKHHLRTN